MKAIIPTFHAENRYWLADGPKQEFYLYFELTGAKAPADEKKRVPLNISLVLDRSGSMQGDKIAFVKKAAQFVIDNLAGDDFLSVVQYDNKIDVVCPSAKVQNKTELKRRVEEITSRGMTNLSGGMLSGYEQVSSTKQDKLVNRLLLLSDGLANQGITQPEQLQELAQQKFREEGIALSTFGVGGDFNELLMTNLSEYGGANYYFIDRPDKIPSIFAEELRGLLAVVAQNVKLEIRFPGDHFRAEKLYGFPGEIHPDRVSVNFNDLFSEEKKAILLKLVAHSPLTGDFELSATLRYDNATENFAPLKERLQARVQLTHVEADVAAGLQPAVAEQTALFVSNEMYEQAVTLADRRDFEGAMNMIREIKAYLDKYLQTLIFNGELMRQYKEILRYENELPAISRMTGDQLRMAQKLSRSENYLLRKKKP